MNKGWLKHAFAVDPPGPAEPTPEQQPAVDAVCRQVAKRHLMTPALIGLEMSRPLNYMAASLMHVFSPGVWAIARQQTHENYKHFATFLEHRGSIEYLCQRIEHFESQFERRAREAKATAKRDKAERAGHDLTEDHEED